MQAIAPSRSFRFKTWIAHLFGVGPVEDMPASVILVSAASTKLDMLFVRRLLALLKPYWWRWRAWPSWTAYAISLGATLVTAWMGAVAMRLSGDALNALQAKAESAYWQLTLAGLSVSLGVWLASSVFSTAVGNILNIHWDQWLTKRLLGIYLSNRTYYDIVLHQDIDNPDQRIQNEVQQVVSALATLPSTVLTPLFTSVLQIGIVMSVSPAMMWVAIGYCVVQTVATVYILRPQVAFQWKATVASADFRHNLVSVREHSETIAFYRGEASEELALGKRLDRSVRAQRAAMYYAVFVGGLSQAFTMAWMVLPLLVVTPLYFAGKIPMGTIAEATGAAALVVTSLGSLKDVLPTLARAAPSIVRLAEFQERLEKMNRLREEQGIPQIDYSVGDRISFDKVTIDTPDGSRTIVRDLTLVLPARQPLLIVGQTGVGKSSVLRALAGLWTRGHGNITVPAPHELMFLPQRPYMMLGTLQQQIFYPHADMSLSIAELSAILAAVQLPDLLERMNGPDAVRDWRSVLSLGEQQRLAFARVLVSRPRLVFLDESTSAVDVETERGLYALLSETVENYVSVGHRPTLVDYHAQVLSLRQDGWSIAAVAASDRTRAFAEMEI